MLKVIDMVRQAPGRAWRAARDPRKIRAWWDVRQDYRAYRQAFHFLAGAAAHEQPGKRLLIVSLSNWVAQIKVESMLASALRLRGWSPAVLTWSGCREAHRYFPVAGITDLIDLDGELRAAGDGRAGAEQLAGAMLAGASTLEALLQVRHRDVWIGRHVLSTCIRTSLHGRINLSDASTQAALRRGLVEAIRVVDAAHRLLDRLAPHTVLFLEKGYSPFGELYDVAVNRGLNVIHWHHGHRADALVLKRYTARNRHLHAFSLSEASWEAARQMPWTDRHEQALDEETMGRYRDGSWFNRKFHHHNKRVKTPAEVRAQLGLDPGKKTAVIFSHVLWDATFFFGANLFDDYEEWLIETVKAACRNDAVNWVVKIHPDYVWKLKMLGGGTVRDHLALQVNIGALPPHVTLLHPDTDLSTGSLFGVMDYCITVRGTIGIEASCFGIPVLTAGTGRYSGLGFTVDSRSRGEYVERLLEIQKMPRMSAEHTELARRHAYALLRLRPCPFTSFQVVQTSLQRMGHPLDHNVAFRVQSLAELQGAADLRRFAEWVDGRQGEDFLLPDPVSAEPREAVETGRAA